MSSFNFKKLSVLFIVLSVTACGGDSDTSSIPKDSNNSPIAEAGSNQFVKTLSIITLNGSQSSDADNDLLTYKWSITSKPLESSTTLSDVNAVKPTFIPDLDGDYVLALTVNDGTVDSNSDVVIITAATVNSKPVANAGNDQEVTTGEVVTLNGSQSSDADNDLLTYKWSITSKPLESSTTLSDVNAVKPTFTPDLDGDYVFSLIVNDNTVNSDVSSITVMAKTNPIINIFRYDNTNSFSQINWPDGWSSFSITGFNTDNVIIETYKLQAIGQDFTIIDFYVDDYSNNVIPFISGIEEQMIITKGSEREFKLISPYKDGVKVNLIYQFKIKETGQMFNTLYGISFNNVNPPVHKINNH